LWGAREIAGLILASLVAGCATTPYAAFHFHRLAPYGVIANLLAMPVVSLVVMPAGILGLVAMPFGFDAPLWRLMGLGLDWMIFIAQWVANLPGAVGRFAAFGTGPLLLGTLGLLLVCLLRTRLRWSGAVIVVAASIWAAGSPQPDIYVAADRRAAAVRGDNGRLSIMLNGRDTFAVREWLAADADGRAADDKSLKDGVRCDEKGCVGRLRDGRLVAFTLSPNAFAEDCVRSNVVISSREGPADCKALLIDSRSRGSGALSLAAGSLAITPARAQGYDRPWSRHVPAKVASTAPRDATPREDDLETGD
jgi:competence protein ComEC